MTSDDTAVPPSGAAVTAASPDRPWQACPDCGERTPADTRFVVWCAACGWNTDPLPPDPPRGRLRTRRHALATRHGEQLHAELVGKGVDAPLLDSAGVAAYAIAWAVHLATAALTVCGVLLIVLGWPLFLQVALGAVLLLIVAVLRPRLGRLPQHAAFVDRARAPHLYGLVDRVAAEAGTRSVDAIVLDGVTNASVSEYGLRRRRVLRLGLPLWRTLTAQQRVALLGHELGHYANGDTRRGLVVGTALNTLGSWLDVLRPDSRRGRDLTHTLANWLISVPWFVVLCLIHLLDHFTLRASQRAEYRADVIAARIGSTEAAAELFDRLLILPSVNQELRRQAILARTRNRGSDPKAVEAGLWTRLADHASTVTDHEWERLRRVSVRRGHSTDATHPPTHLRVALLTGGPQQSAAVTLDPAEAAAIDAELAATGQQVAKAVLRDMHL